MEQTRVLMGMPITVAIADKHNRSDAIEKVFDYFISIDNTFSTYKKTSEISKINRGELREKDFSPDVKEIFRLSEQTKNATDGYFDITHNGSIDPSGIVKGWAIFQAADMLKKMGFHNYYIDAGGDIQVAGKNKKGGKWRIGIKNPFNQKEIIKVVELNDLGIATSGTYIRGQHIYDPVTKKTPDIVSLSVIGPNVYEADRFATAAYAMGRQGIHFIEKQPGLEGYMIDRKGIATYTTGFEQFVTT